MNVTIELSDEKSAALMGEAQGLTIERWLAQIA